MSLCVRPALCQTSFLVVDSARVHPMGRSGAGEAANEGGEGVTSQPSRCVALRSGRRDCHCRSRNRITDGEPADGRRPSRHHGDGVLLGSWDTPDLLAIRARRAAAEGDSDVLGEVDRLDHWSVWVHGWCGLSSRRLDCRRITSGDHGHPYGAYWRACVSTRPTKACADSQPNALTGVFMLWRHSRALAHGRERGPGGLSLSLGAKATGS
jgi:hypothetical protein